MIKKVKEFLANNVILTFFVSDVCDCELYDLEMDNVFCRQQG